MKCILYIKKCVIIGILMAVVLLLLVSCSNKKAININTAKVLIYGGMLPSSCVLEVKSNGTLIVTSGGLSEDLFLNTITRDEFFQDPYAKQESKKMSKGQQEKVNDLIIKIKERMKEGNNYGGTDIRLIRANIGGNNYLSSFSPWGGSNDPPNELQELTYKLIDIAPFRIPGLTRITRLERLGRHVAYENVYVYIRLVSNRVFRINAVIMILVTLITGLLISLLFTKLSKSLNKKWISFIPYALCFVGVIFGFIMAYLLDGSYKDLQTYCVYLFMYSISTFIAILLRCSISRLRKGL